MSEYINFRQKLDRVLRTQDVKQVQEFLIAEQQWSEEAPADPELAMWLMIAGSPALKDLHPRASQWLIQHGHESEAQALLAKSKSQQKPRPANRPPQTPSAKKTGSSSEKSYTQQRVKRNWSH